MNLEQDHSAGVGSWLEIMLPRFPEIVFYFVRLISFEIFSKKKKKKKTAVTVRNLTVPQTTSGSTLL